MRHATTKSALVLLGLLILTGETGGRHGSPDPRRPGSIPVPLTDLRDGAYFGFLGGLYEDGRNAPPADHRAAGMARARQIVPRDRDGNPHPRGTYVLLSVGMSNATQEFCSRDSSLPCDPWTFMGRALADPTVNHETLAIVNGASGGQDASAWDSPAEANYDRIRDTRLAPRGLSENQVQIVWLKVANRRPIASLPSADADAYALETRMGDIVRALKVRYPNLAEVFISSRTYAGYATSDLNPEPQAYESGFAVKWLVRAQISQMENDGRVVDPRAGDLNYATVAPWIAWGAYLWADGTEPRSDGLIWRRSDFEEDGAHPSPSGESKAARLLLRFFKSAPFASCWFRAGESCA